MMSDLVPDLVLLIAGLIFLSLITVLFVRRVRTGKYWTARDERRWKTHPSYPTFFTVVTLTLLAALAIHNFAPW
jgi:hypothetical protein